MSSDVARASTAEGETSSTKKDSKRPKDSRFFQQELPACKPLLTPGWVITIYMLVGVVFIPIGVLALLASNSVVEVVDQYETKCLNHNLTDTEQKVNFIQNATTNKSCIRTFIVPKRMKQPVYVYYELDKFYQNHRRMHIYKDLSNHKALILLWAMVVVLTTRMELMLLILRLATTRYVNSRSDMQLLHGSSATDTQKCKPEQYLSNNESLTIIPCGLIAWSLFNDTYNFAVENRQISVNKTGISWKSDRDHKFGKNVYPQNFPNNLRNESGVLVGGAELDPTKPLNEDEDLIVWMRLAALPTFRKLYGRIEQSLEANTTVTVHINNVYNTYSFGGKKKLVLSTTSWLGGKNAFLGIAYITVGSICIFLAFLFFLIHIANPRPLGDTTYLSWNKK